MRLTLLCFILCLGVLLAGCAAVTQPLAIGPAPWQAGETAEYDVLDRAGVSVGVATWLWETAPEGWRQSWTVVIGPRIERGVVVLGNDLRPVSSELEEGGNVHAAMYGPEQTVLTTTPAQGEVVTRSFSRLDQPIDNGQSLQVHRALPLSEGYATRYTIVVPTTGSAAPMLVRVVGREMVDTAAGAFETWRVVMTAGAQSHDAWYAVEPPHVMVKYHNRAAGSQLVLTRWRPSADAPWAPTPPGAP